MGISDRHLVLNVSTDSVDFMDGTKNSDVINVSEWDEIYFIISRTTGATGTAEVRIHSAPDSTPSSTDPVSKMWYRYCDTSTTDSTMSAWTEATSSGFVMSAGSFQIWEVFTTVEQLYANDGYVFLNSTEITNSPVGGSAVCLLAGPRYGCDIANDVLT